MSYDFNRGFQAGMQSCQLQMQKKIDELARLLDESRRAWCRTVPGYFICKRCKEVCVTKVGEYDGMCEECFDEEDDAACQL